MRLTKLTLRNFRCFEALDLDLDRDVSLIFGVNGAGKSALVQALALALTPLPGRSDAQTFLNTDLRLVTTGAGGLWSREQAADAAIGVSLQQPALSWQLSLTRGEEAKLSGRHLEFQRWIQSKVDRPDPLPVVAFYRASRAWRDGPSAGASPEEGRLAGYASAMHAGRDLAELRAWWRDLDHHRRGNKPAPALDAAERAVAGLLGQDAALPVYDTELKDIVVDVPALDGRFALRELSDGYRGLIALVCDLASRAARLNPLAGEDLLATVSGVVVIDEIDLHLHPQLQTEVLPALRRVFPKLQFILTTHSPLLLGSVRDNSEVIRLGADHGVTTDLPVEGRAPDAILGGVMGARLRPLKHEALLRDLYAAIDARDIAQAEKLLASLASRWSELDPEVVRARTYLDWER